MSLTEDDKKLRNKPCKLNTVIKKKSIYNIDFFFIYTHFYYIFNWHAQKILAQSTAELF